MQLEADGGPPFFGTKGAGPVCGGAALCEKLTLLALALMVACGGADQDPGEITAVPRPVAETAGPQILFGDLHVHTTYSMDAFFTSLPLLGGEGAHPPADACDFARHCAALDFFAITDHAMELTPAHWAMEKEATRQCNGVAGDPANPDLVAFHGWEWTQVGTTPEKHWGHKNVIFRELAEDRVPARPISAVGPETVSPWAERAPAMAMAWLIDPLNAGAYLDFGWMVDQIDATPLCDPDAHTRELPDDCHENAPTPDVLFRKLDEWGFDSIVIPHGTAWGSYSPPGTAWDKQLAPAMHDPGRQVLIEVMSGHGSSEQYRDWREVESGPDGERLCPEPTDDYMPCCWRAGEIVRERCGDLPADVCESRVEEARRLTLEANVTPDLVLPGTSAEQWLDCGQDRRGFKPAYGLRPRGTAQYAWALSREGEAGEPLRFRFGSIASSDTHSGRAATGFKQPRRRRGWTDIAGLRSDFHAGLLLDRGEPADPQRAEPPSPALSSPLVAERMASFLYPGGTVAVHARGRDRDAIWSSLVRREVYGTSGPRILLWFDLIDESGRRPMGSEVRRSTAPAFEVRAVGAHVQKPGCPADVVDALGEERVRSLCLGECYHPGDARHPISAIEVVRVRPQRTPDEDVTTLVDDPWLTLACPADPSGCRVRFEDPDFASSGRDAVYYVRALQESTPAINGANLRTRFEDGRAVSVEPCRVGAGARSGDDCLAEVEERAWSSPIFVDFGA